MAFSPQHRILLTGASGGLGRNLLDLIAADERFEVLCLLRDGSRSPPAAPRRQAARVDFNDPASLSAAIAAFRPTALIHAAATGMNMPKPGWAELIRFNVNVSIGLCEALAAAQPGCHFVFIGSGAAYGDRGRRLVEGDPLDATLPYGASKAAADSLTRAACLALGLPVTVLRPFSFTGLGDDGTRLFPAILRAAVEGRAMDLSAGDQLRDHCATGDIAAGIVAAVTTSPPPSGTPAVYNLGSGDMISLRDLIAGIVRDLDLKVTLNFGARPYAPREPMVLVADATAARRDLGWRLRTSLSYAVWALARESFPSLSLRQPAETSEA